MDGRSVWMVGAIVLLAAVPALAQAPANAEEPPGPPADRAPALAGAELLERALADAGVPDDVRGLFRIMAQDDLDPAMLLALMAMGGHGNVDEGLLFFTMLMRGMGGQTGQPTAVVRGDQLLVVEDGVVYRVDLATMALQGQVTFRPKRDRAAALAKLVPLVAGMRAQGPEAMREEAERDALEQTCVSNLKQLALACLMYAKDHNGILMTANWADEVMQYAQNDALLRCPSIPDDVLSYAMNEKLLGLSLDAIADPSRVVLLFEREPAEGPAIGGPDKLVARHDGNTVVAFADGHVEAIPIDQAMQQLRWDPE